MKTKAKANNNNGENQLPVLAVTKDLGVRWANLKSNLTLKSQSFVTGDSNLQAKSQILNRISHQNLESSNSQSQIKYQIPKQQKGFSKHISILLVISLQT